MSKETFDWIDKISQKDWDKLNSNERTITIKGEDISTDLEDYKPPFNIKILEITDRMAIVKFSIGNFDYIKNIAMEYGKYYLFGRWGIHINNPDKKNKDCIFKIREEQ